MDSSKKYYSFNLREVTYALSEAFDYVGVDDVLHGKRVAFIASQIAKEIPFSEDDIDEMIYAGMLHDCGVSSTDVHSFLVSELDWDNSPTHCIRGSELLEKVSFFKHYAPIVLLHHTHWDAYEDTHDETLKLKANLIYLADRIDAIGSQYQMLGEKATHNIQETIKKYAGHMFSPKLVEIFLKISAKNSFWFHLEPEALDMFFKQWIQKGKTQKIDFEELKEISLLFASSVDAKSKFTYEHSLGVSKLARYLSELLGLKTKASNTIEIAGLLHDLGKLRVVDAILDKPGKLNADERIRMNRHSFDSEILLKKIKGFKDIADISSMHHEKLDAKGYPYCLKASEIPIEARILTVADIFQALIQDRPYRKSMPLDDAMEILRTMQKEHQIDAKVLQTLEDNLQTCYAIAVQHKL